MLKLNIPGQIISYVDDTALVFSDSTWEGVKKKEEVGLHEVAKWLKQNKLTLNKSKSKFLTFSLRNLGDSKIKKLKLHQCINANTCNNCHSYIENVDSIKHLGVTIDQFLKWEKHIQLLVNKMRCLIYKFYQLKQSMNINLVISIL